MHMGVIAQVVATPARQASTVSAMLKEQRGTKNVPLAFLNGVEYLLELIKMLLGEFGITTVMPSSDQDTVSYRDWAETHQNDEVRCVQNNSPRFR
jgi:hypothetical protein